MSSKTDDDDDSVEEDICIVEFTDSMHVRAGMLADLPQSIGWFNLSAHNLGPSDDHEGMLRHKHSIEMETRLNSSLYTQEEQNAARRLSSSVIAVGGDDKKKATSGGITTIGASAAGGGGMPKTPPRLPRGSLRSSVSPLRGSQMSTSSPSVTRTPPSAAAAAAFGTSQGAAYVTGEADIISKVLEQVDLTATRRMREGFNERNFSLGVLNTLLVCFVFAKYPQHFWLLYFVETLALVPTKFYYMYKAKPLNEALYYLDYCWFLNFCGVFLLGAFLAVQFLQPRREWLIDVFGFDETWTQFDIPIEYRRNAYLAAMGAACGPLLGATVVLPFVALLFHDVRTMTNLFIHILPPMVAYTFLWHTDDIKLSWPDVFRLVYRDDIQFFSDRSQGGILQWIFPGTALETVAGNTLALYFCWFVPYCIWMVTIGMDLPRTDRHSVDKKTGLPLKPKYDTVFHSTVRGGLCILIGKIFWGRPKSDSIRQMEKNDYELRDLCVYMLGHAVMFILSIYALAYPCFTWKQAHAAMLLALLVVCVYRGSKRYTYYSTAMYGRQIRKNFEDLLAMDNDGGAKKTN